MDIVRSKQKNKIKIKKWFYIAAISVVSLVLIINLSGNSSTYHVDKFELLLAEVQRGQFNISVRGVGVLVPKDVRWVATNVEGRVERILIKAGAKVTKGDLLLELSNPQLVQQLEETKWQLEEMVAETNAQNASLASELLDQEAAVINEKLNHERALLTYNAQKTLLDKGTVAVSHIAHEEVKIDVAQYKERWQLEIKRLNKKKESLTAQAKAYQARLNRMHKIYQRAQQQVESLKVHATMDSIVQAMPMELGQRVLVGSNLARLARSGEFIAELRVPEKQIKDVALGQSVVVDTRNSKIKGIVQRIDPIVNNGSVQVDIELIGNMPKDARPDLTVNGVIAIANIENTLFVKRPMFANEHSESFAYVLTEDGNQADKVSIHFGQTSTQYIQVTSGLALGNNIIISDVSAWEKQQSINVN
ncbi:RND transporter [Colwellia sp. 75C3]|uniref:efflux RND transporter periplasmic adaptor subunit n=1 Tax=Colwellia sp. 75C3 TaxID=888425 RepID=UPI000C336419|nr:efflux RND transporter periplasmic adaptor subunit [Colwellia sp. 75C3]PKG81499.1 RND transporter [Colwellia sp. 75C3]